MGLLSPSWMAHERCDFGHQYRFGSIRRGDVVVLRKVQRKYVTEGPFAFLQLLRLPQQRSISQQVKFEAHVRSDARVAVQGLA